MQKIFFPMRWSKNCSVMYKVAIYISQLTRRRKSDGEKLLAIDRNYSNGTAKS